MQIDRDHGKGNGDDGAVEIIDEAGGEEQAGDGPGTRGRDGGELRQISILPPALVGRCPGLSVYANMFQCFTESLGSALC
jgi:hypothetical protein